MKIKLAASCFVISAFLAPVTLYAADEIVSENNANIMSYVSDSVITTKVKTLLAAEKLDSLARIAVDTDSVGAVVLSGQVTSQAEVDKAVSIARGIEGVTSVTSNLRIKAEN